MSQDYSLRFEVNEARLKNILPPNIESRLLPRVKDHMFKPKRVSLSDYWPDKVCVRLREFIDGSGPSSLDEIVTNKTEAGYTDTKKELSKGSTADLIFKAESLGYEKWGEISYMSTEYKYPLGNTTVTLLVQNIEPLGHYLKIEANTNENLKKAVRALQLESSEPIDKNAAVLLAEKID